ncbi:VOC family protein [Marinobacter xestospongiae]|uniref:VOC family protein n=1 Tax=Marinobacter xestospongiae TaxID=994319 RepID=A0ABU3W2M7_9GAMM|nr:VOC family protein [Marinobacter xestospongiae]MDV2080798.1 VOC family protein [Marinobacter xestospongiae]
MTNPIPDGMTGLIPHLVCDPCDQAIEFYARAFGAEELSRSVHPGTGKILHAAMRLGSQVLFMSDDFPEFCADGKPSSPQALGGTPVTVHRYVADCDAALATAQSAGATLVMPAKTCSGAIATASWLTRSGTAGRWRPTSVTSPRMR